MLFALVGVVALALIVTVRILVVRRRHTRNAQREEVVGLPSRDTLENFENGGDQNHNSLVPQNETKLMH